MKDRTIVIEIAESEFTAIMQLDTDAGRSPNIEYRIRHASPGPRLISQTGNPEIDNGSQMDDESEHAYTNFN